MPVVLFCKQVLYNPRKYGLDAPYDVITVTPPYEEVVYAELVKALTVSDVSQGSRRGIHHPGTGGSRGCIFLPSTAESSWPYPLTKRKNVQRVATDTVRVCAVLFRARGEGLRASVQPGKINRCLQRVWGTADCLTARHPSSEGRTFTSNRSRPPVYRLVIPPHVPLPFSAPAVPS